MDVGRWTNEVLLRGRRADEWLPSLRDAAREKEKQLLGQANLEVVLARRPQLPKPLCMSTFNIGDVPRPTNRLLPAEAERP